MSESWLNKLDAIKSFAFAALFFFVPLVFWPRNSELFEFNKMQLTYLLTGVILAAWVSQWITQKKITFRRTFLDLPLLLFFLSQLLSTIFSIDRHTSIWGYYSRYHGGLASTVSYLVLYFAFVNHFQGPNLKRLKLILYSILASTALVSIYGVLEHFGIDKKYWVQDVQSRVFSTLGQPNWLSAYLAAVLPLPLYLALKNLKTDKIQWTIVLFFLSFTLLILITIYFTKSRSGIAATALVLALVALHQIGSKFKLAYLILPLLLVPILYLRWPSLQKMSPFGVPDLNQLVEEDLRTRHAGSDSMIIRQVVWKGAFDLFKRKPIFGSGVETFGYAYYWTRPVEHNLLSEWDFLYNKAHNEYYNFLATTGIVGLGTYLLLILATLAFFVRLIRAHSKEILLPALLIGYVSILVTNYFGFSVVPVTLLFFLYPALALALTTPAEKPAKIKFAPLSTGQYLLLTTVILALSYWFILIARQWLADVNYAYGKLLQQAGYYPQALTRLEKAVAIYPGEPVIRAQLAEAQMEYSLAVNQKLNSLSPDQKQKLNAAAQTEINRYREQALDTVNQALIQNPWNLNFYKSKAKIELSFAQQLDPTLYQSALNTLLKANELAPTDTKVLYHIGAVYTALNKRDLARTALTKTLELKPDYQNAINLLNSL